MVDQSTINVSLFDGFRLASPRCRQGLRPAAQRLVAFLALHRRRHRRSYLAGWLWPHADEPRALASLRSTLWHVRRHDGIVDADKGSLQLAASVLVDTDVLAELTARLRTVSSGDAPSAPGWTDRFDELVARLGRELLPGWYDDWVELERQRIHQVRLHALEALADLRTRQGAHLLALDAALRAVRLEPLRESAHLAIVRIHLDEGNISEAVRAHDRYAALLGAELGIAPSPHMTRLIADAMADRVIDVTPFEGVLALRRSSGC